MMNLFPSARAPQAPPEAQLAKTTLFASGQRRWAPRELFRAN